jgi:S1-C subfamily serine protease
MLGLAQTAAKGELKLKVIIVDQLTPKPVVFTDFSITGGAAAQAKQVLRTDESGTIDVKLDAGNYVLDNVKPVPFNGKSYVWHREFSIAAGQVTSLSLTDADASSNTERVVSDEANIYQQYKDGVVTVESDFGHGSGFLVDSSGLILTNQHVVNDTHWLGVRLKPGRRCEATVVAEDKEADVAVIAINPEFCKDLKPLRLADVSKPPLAVEGEKILAIGSPLHQETILTTGIVSKVEAGVLMSNVNINHGNSGGPILNMAGNVVGIATFGDIDRQGGPGVSGIVSIEKAMPVLNKAKDSMSSVPAPSAEPLPDVNAFAIPASLLDAVTEKDTQHLPTMRAPRNCETSFDTAFMVQARVVAANAKIRDKMKSRGDSPDEPSSRAFWRQFANPTDAVVIVNVKPLQRGSGLFFKEEFYDMQLFRGDKLVQPVRRNRVLWYVHNLQGRILDKTYGGSYQYDYSAFDPSEEMKFKMREAGNLDKWEEVKIDPKVQRQIWDQFASYRAAASSH